MHNPSVIGAFLRSTPYNRIMTPSYEALRHSAAILDLSPRGRILARGRDRARLLHNLTSNEVKKMTPGA